LWGGLGFLFADGYVTNPRIFFCTEPYFNGASHYTYDSSDFGWANWNQSGKYVTASITLPNRFYSKGDLVAVKAACPSLSEFLMSNILSDSTKKVILACYLYKYSSGAKPPHAGAGVNTIFGDNSGRWQSFEPDGPDTHAIDIGFGEGDNLFSWLNAHASR
ncbi:MAG: hypothetical protein ACYC4Q_08745, partial [Victivallaceae bacterium]